MAAKPKNTAGTKKPAATGGKKATAKGPSVSTGGQKATSSK